MTGASTTFGDEPVFEQRSLKDQIENERLYRALDVLTQKQVLILEMIYVNNLTLREIANILDSTPQNVSNLHRKALEKLKKEQAC
ncbi:sigma-70 family RNA polymerase sigma factor [Geobacillus sp. CAMR5420]|uniref:sigma-70 family RNA polymerase sigma factor n=1 Tax=Geobacillus TaxID=129337 RepID=UPI0009DEFE4B|nr:sigma-70 family RNA polymerase sigma factor [Geobacillus sp. CAMR5420]